MMEIWAILGGNWGKIGIFFKNGKETTTYIWIYRNMKWLPISWGQKSKSYQNDRLS